MPGKCPVCNNIINEGIVECPHCGFKLPDATQRFAPVSLNLDAPAYPENDGRKPIFKIVRGPQTGSTISLEKGSLKIGRSPQCDIFLNDMTVSREHALLKVGETSCVIYDTNSYNGVWVNDENVVSRVLAPGDIIQIGTFSICYQRV